MARDGVPAVSRSRLPRRLECAWCWWSATRVSCMRQRSQDERSASSSAVPASRRAAQGLRNPDCGLVVVVWYAPAGPGCRHSDSALYMYLFSTFLLASTMPLTCQQPCGVRRLSDMRILIWPRCMTCPAFSGPVLFFQKNTKHGSSPSGRVAKRRNGQS